MDIVPFRPDHIRHIDMRELERRRLCLIGEVHKYARTLAISGFSFTAFEGGEIIGCAGILPLGDNVGGVWFLPSARLPEGRPNKLWVSVDRLAREVLAFSLKRGFRKLEAPIYEDFIEGRRWLERLGFMSGHRFRNHGGNCIVYMKGSG